MKKTAALILAALMALTALVVIPASAETSGDWEYEVYEDWYEEGVFYVEITGYTGTATDLTFPKTLGGYTVTEIGSDVFYENETIVNITIPDTIDSIYGNPFSECYSLKNITVDPTNPEFKSIDGVLYSKDGTALIACPACIELTSFTIPDTVTTIGNYAFYNCASLASFSIPDSVTEIGYGAFSGSGYYNNDENWEDGALYIGNCLIFAYNISGNYTIKSGTSIIADSAFSYCEELESVVIPDTVKIICDSAFAYCNVLKSITIPGSVSTVGCGIFCYCSSLETVTIMDGVTIIGEMAFENCTSLKSITIPSSVTYIDYCAFVNCTALETVHYGGSEEQWNDIEINTDGIYYYFQTTDGEWDEIEIENGNEALFNAKKVFNSNGTQTDFTPADANGDGKINNRDVILVMKAVLAATSGAPAPAGLIFDAADMNGDGKLNNRDVIAVMKAVLAAQAK